MKTREFEIPANPHPWRVVEGEGARWLVRNVDGVVWLCRLPDRAVWLYDEADAPTWAQVRGNVVEDPERFADQLPLL